MFIKRFYNRAVRLSRGTAGLCVFFPLLGGGRYTERATVVNPFAKSGIDAAGLFSELLGIW